MKRLFFVLLTLLLVLNVSASELYDRLIRISGVRSIEQVDKGFFAERYIIMFEQPLDHQNPEKGNFEQRIILGHAGFKNPNVMITEGYGAAYALNPKFRHEISNHLNANQIFVEHRFFGESTPSPRNWRYLTGENAAGDLHAIKNALSNIYTQKWVATGISKGGQNAMIYNTFYPSDMDVTVAYVGPICTAIEDEREQAQIANTGSAEERKTILDFQSEVLRRRSALMPMFEEYVKAKELKFRLPLNEIYDYCVLEYPFSIWQWGTALSVIPDTEASHDEIFEHLMTIVAPDYFAISDEPSFFVQAATELGYYNYETQGLKELLTIKSSKNYVSKIFLPDDARKTKFSDKLAKRMLDHLKNSDPKLICIYGQNDPWTAAAPDRSYFEHKKNMLFMVEQGGSHKARINTLSTEDRNRVWATLESWVL